MMGYEMDMEDYKDEKERKLKKEFWESIEE